MAWKNIWNNRTHLITESQSDFMYMKYLNGFDVIEGQLNEQDFKNQILSILKYFEEHKYTLHTLFEVGCGSGANFMVAQEYGLKTGGLDYSQSLIEVAQKYLDDKFTIELIQDEAVNLDSTLQYDLILSNSVFSYFANEDYAEETLNKMVKKSKIGIVLLDIHDIEKEEQYDEYREQTIPNYQERYRGLSKLFYPKQFFIDFAEKQNLKLEIKKSYLKNYWNPEFVYDCYFVKHLMNSGETF